MKSKFLKVFTLIALSVFIQNCSGYKGADSDHGLSLTGDSSDDLVGIIEETFSVEENIYIESVEGLDSTEQSHLGEKLAVEGSNESQLASKTKCTFYFKGQRGAEWISERYVGADENCSKELDTVKSNNPLASITKIVENFVFDTVASVHKTKCTYFFVGLKGAEWFSERYIPWGDNCEGVELELVRKNNPNARIVKIFSNYVHDNTRFVSKTKCTFYFEGEQRARWISERYIENDEECVAMLPQVRINNPKAKVLKIEDNFVHDPF